MGEKRYTYDFANRDEMLNKMRAYAETPDDEACKYKDKIKERLVHCPELLLALNDSELEKEAELFDTNGNLNIDENGDPLGEWDLYFGESSHIRPFLYIPETKTDTENLICYQVSFEELPRYNNIQKYTLITFTIFVHGMDRTDITTGLPRHDLIASIIREKFNWSSIFGIQTKLISSKESITDNNYLVRTLVFQILDLNGISNTPYGGGTTVRNTNYWK